MEFIAGMVLGILLTVMVLWPVMSVCVDGDAQAGRHDPH